MAKKRIMTAKRLKARKIRRALWLGGVLAFTLYLGHFAENFNLSQEAAADPNLAEAINQQALTKEDLKQSEEQDLQDLSDFTVKIQTKDGSIIEQNMEEYLCGVLAAEMPANFELEALKAQAVAARSYAVDYLGKNDYIPAGTSAQDWLSTEEQKERWGDNYPANREKIVQAVSETANEVLFWQGAVIEAVYHSSCGGYKTAAAADVWGGYVPYLQSVECPHGEDKHSNKESIFSREEFADLLNAPKKGDIKITATDTSGRVLEIAVGAEKFQGSEVRSALGLASTAFSLQTKGEEVIITTNGSGHGVGMCQYGADYFARKGWDYQQILAHFYQETELGEV